MAESQIKQVATELVEASREMYGIFGMDLKFRLSFRDDGDGYLGEKELWAKAQGQLEELAKENGLDYYIEEGEAAFYGPKIDFMATDAIGRNWQVATVQFDFVQPQRFKLEYTAEDGTQQQPVMVHCALLGSIERFLSVYIEHTAGKFPVWCAPEQVRVLSVNQEESTVAFVEGLREQGRALGLRITTDNSNESVGKKIRAAEMWKVPYTLVIGEKEMGGGELTPRIRKDLAVSDEATSYTAEEFLKTVANEAKSRVSKTSL